MIISEEVRRACLNPEFKLRFKENPRACLIELGYLVNNDIDLVIHEDTPRTIHITLPIDGWGGAPDAQDADIMGHPGSGVCDNSASSATCCYVTPTDNK